MSFFSYMLVLLWMLPVLAMFALFYAWSPTLAPHLLVILVLCMAPLAILALSDRRKKKKEKDRLPGD